MILGLAGLAHCGKSTAATYLERELGFARVRFAGPLKAMLRAFFAESGVPAGEIERLIEGDLKEDPADVLAGASPRRAMQTLGNEWGRDLIAPNLWTAAWTASAKAALARGARGIVVEDVRYPNEAAAIRALGGRVVRIVRPGTAPTSAPGHVSEAQDFPVDLTVQNDGAPALLLSRIDRIADHLRFSELPTRPHVPRRVPAGNREPGTLSF